MKGNEQKGPKPFISNNGLISPYYMDKVIYSFHGFLVNFLIFLFLFFFAYTVDSRYLEVEGTLWNTSRYPYFDISDVQNWGKYQMNNQISQMNM